ncbi:hypothetical protein [Nocardia sp. CA-135398]|uniref:hypothetical protein n=1 Tax=Nocardia sp. CA-135398 TaxID=3239977 RepID=UPI003D97606D
MEAVGFAGGADLAGEAAEDLQGVAGEVLGQAWVAKDLAMEASGSPERSLRSNRTATF